MSSKLAIGTSIYKWPENSDLIGPARRQTQTDRDTSFAIASTYQMKEHQAIFTNGTPWRVVDVGRARNAQFASPVIVEELIAKIGSIGAIGRIAAPPCTNHLRASVIGSTLHQPDSPMITQLCANVIDT
jgi:hypothetical protein